MIIILLFGIFVYSFLYYQQREIDNNLGTVKGIIISYKMSAPQSGMCIKYKFYVNGIIYFGSAFPHEKINIDYNKKYTIEYSIKNPNINRIIIENKAYSKGVN